MVKQIIGKFILILIGDYLSSITESLGQPSIKGLNIGGISLFIVQNTSSNFQWNTYKTITSKEKKKLNSYTLLRKGKNVLKI